jgi:hypothetical protein
MNLKKLVALGGASVLLALLSAGAAFAAGGTQVTVRVEGLKQMLLRPTVVRTHSGWITRYGATKGECPATSGQGALDVATHHRWRGTWSTQFGPEYEITSILGETHSFSSKYYWEIFADNVSATVGGCELKLHRGEQLLFAAVPQTGTEYPLGLTLLSRPQVGRPFKVKVVYYNGRGKPKPLAGATVTAAGISAEPIPHDRVTAKTDARGIAKLTENRLGLVEITASKRGYVRAAPVNRDVT